MRRLPDGRGQGNRDCGGGKAGECWKERLVWTLVLAWPEPDALDLLRRRYGGAPLCSARIRLVFRLYSARTRLGHTWELRQLCGVAADPSPGFDSNYAVASNCSLRSEERRVRKECRSRW